MKKMLTLALAFLLALVSVTPVSAQNRGRRYDNRRGNLGSYGYDGYHGTALERSTRQTMGMVDGLFGEIGYGSHGRYSDPYDYRTGGGYNPRYDSRYDYGYYPYRGRHETRNVLLGTAAMVGGAILIDKIANRHDGDSGSKPGDDVSKCFERALKAAKKTKTPVDSTAVMAMCSGQPLPQATVAPEPEPPSERAAGINESGWQSYDQPPAQQAQTPRAYPQGAFIDGDRLCNNYHLPLTVLVNGTEILVVAPGGSALLSRLPQGHRTWRY